MYPAPPVATSTIKQMDFNISRRSPGLAALSIHLHALWLFFLCGFLQWRNTMMNRACWCDVHEVSSRQKRAADTDLISRFLRTELRYLNFLTLFSRLVNSVQMFWACGGT